MYNNGIEEYVYRWAVSFPLDRYWRKKHNVPFGSIQHRDVSFIDQLIEYQEDILFMKLSEQDKYLPGRGEWLRKQEMAAIDVDEAFDNINLNNIKA